MENYDLGQGIVLLCLNLPCSLYVLIKGWKGLDKAMIVIIISYMFAFATDVYNYDKGFWGYIYPWNDALTQLLIYFFVFEMVRLRNKIQSESFEDLL